MQFNKQDKPKRGPGRPKKSETTRKERVEKYGDLAVDRMEICFKGDGVDMGSLTDEQFESALAFEESQRGRMRK